MKEIIKKYLEEFSKENNWNKFDESKLDECCKYITSEAKKKASKNVAVIEDKVVFGWAVHFYDEGGNVEIKDVKLANVMASAKDSIVEEKQEIKVEKKKPVKASKKVKEPEYEEFTLF